MSGTTYGGIQYATGGDAAAIHTISQNLATTTTPRVVSQFPNAAARDAAYSADIAAGRVGMECYCVAEDGHCVYRGPSRGWKWLSYYDVLASPSWAGPGGVSGPWPTNPGAALLTTGVVILPGSTLRRLQVTGIATVKGASGTGITACGWNVSGPGLAPATVMCRLTGLGDAYKETRSGTWHFTASGSGTYLMTGVVFFTNEFVTFEAMQMHLIDHGPA